VVWNLLLQAGSEGPTLIGRTARLFRVDRLLHDVLLSAPSWRTVVGVALLGIVAIGEKAGWWHMAITWQPYFLTLMCISTIPGGFVFLITWRIARRFGGCGLAVVALVAAVLGPVRDYRYMATFPEWGAYAPGLAPVFAISVAYVILGILGHGTMRLVAGPAQADRLARRPWERA
jgi:hypothetical protein